MPRCTPPSAKEIEARPREYALLQQISDSNNVVDTEALADFQKAFGNASKPGSGDTLSFDAFAALFARPPTHADAEGDGNCLGYMVPEGGAAFKPWRFERRAAGPDDVRIQITHAGLCHSDIHYARAEGLGAGAKFPLVPGHEIAGFVTQVGDNVRDFKVGDRCGVGCMVNACMECENCKAGDEQLCCGEGGPGWTYGAEDRDGTPTRGGYSTFVVCNKKFVLHMPDNLPLGDAVPLLCAGITVYSPMRYYGLDKKGMKVAVVGLGGLGHMAVKYLKAFGIEVTVLSRSEGKREEATGVLKADHFLISTKEDDMAAHNGTFDGVIDTVSAKHDLTPGLKLLKANGKYVCIGVTPEPPVVPTMMLIAKRLMVAGTVIGGIKQTQEMLDFSSKHNITCMTETIPIDKLDEAYERVIKSDVRYRFVIDIQGSLIQ